MLGAVGWMVTLLKRISSNVTPVNVTLFGNRVFADVIQFKVEPHYLRVGQNPMADVLVRTDIFEDTEGSRLF